jgi:hypothetical protein
MRSLQRAASSIRVCAVDRPADAIDPSPRLHELFIARQKRDGTNSENGYNAARQR